MAARGDGDRLQPLAHHDLRADVAVDVGRPLHAAHEPDVEAVPEGEDEQQDERENRVEVERCGGEVEAEALFLHPLGQAGDDVGRPGRDRREDADGRGGRVDQVGELRAGDLELVRDGPHHRADREAVEVVVDEDDEAHDDRHEVHGRLAPEPPVGPLAVGARAARARDDRDERAEEAEEEHHRHVLRRLAANQVDDRLERGERARVRQVGVDRRAGEDGGEEGKNDLARFERERDCHEGRDERPQAEVVHIWARIIL